jgi:hypothetical protein
LQRASRIFGSYGAFFDMPSEFSARLPNFSTRQPKIRLACRTLQHAVRIFGWRPELFDAKAEAGD